MHERGEERAGENFPTVKAKKIPADIETLAAQAKLSKTFFLFTAPGFSEGLRCYACISSISWDDCEKRVTEHECPKQVDDVCVREYQTSLPAMNNVTSKPPVFSKHCGVHEECTHKQCAKDGKQCRYQCCSSNLCNTATSATSLTIHGALVVSLLAWSVALLIT